MLYWAAEAEVWKKGEMLNLLLHNIWVEYTQIICGIYCNIEIHVSWPGQCNDWLCYVQLGLILGKDQTFLFTTTSRLVLGALSFPCSWILRTFTMVKSPEIEAEHHLVWRLTRDKALLHISCHGIVHRHKDIFFKFEFVQWIIFWLSHRFLKDLC
jgi:hypothetical protein